MLSIGQIDPRQKTIKKQSEWILIHIERLSLRLLSDLLIVLDVIQIDPLNPITEIMLIDIGIP
jgi:hypothetical protein